MEASGSTLETGESSQREHRKLQRSNTVASGITEAAERIRLAQLDLFGIILPWSKSYKIWWTLTVVAAVISTLTEPYFIAFEAPGLHPSSLAFKIEYTLIVIFFIDILVNFRLAYYDETDTVETDWKKIAVRYLKGLFFLDVLGVLPIYAIAIGIVGEPEERGTLQPQTNLALLRLVRLVRGHRLKRPFAMLQYNMNISLTLLTLIRNLGAAMVWSHFSACVFYFTARQYRFSESNTWIGGSLEGLDSFERYLTTLYWSITTFTTVGYGDFSPVNSVEQIWGMIFMLLNIIIGSWIIGSITLLIVKQDEKTGDYRDTLETLHQYSRMHDFDESLERSLHTQLRLEFNNREIADEQILKSFPNAVRQKILRRLYLPSLTQTSLMDGVREQFVDAFLSTCSVEIFSPYEEILQRGSIASDLYLLVGGVVIVSSEEIDSDDMSDSEDKLGGKRYELEEGEFINEIGFFTETPQVHTVRTKTVCKTLSLSRSAYKLIAEDHPGSVGKILQNLLDKVEEQSRKLGRRQEVELPKRMELLHAGSVFDLGSDKYLDDQNKKEMEEVRERHQTQQALAAVGDLVKMHMNQQKDDHTTRFLFAASRGDVSTIALMCDQGFDPNSADYDFRTALMVSAMKGNTETVKKLLEYGADPNLVDMHGSSALYEATRNGHEDTMDVILEHRGKLCMSEGQSASTLCQTVFDGDILTLRRLLRAKINPNAGDYDKRTAAHIAAAEGSTAAMKVLVDFGTDLTVKDRWNNSIFDEAKRANSGGLLEYLRSLKQ